jgi:poly(hydroxyalkanoate) depolymerase family esterase
MLHSSNFVRRSNKYARLALICAETKKKGDNVLSLGKTIRQLARHRRQWEKLWQAPPGGAHEPPVSPLTEVTGFGANPGALRMFTFVPATLPASPALVVVLHGCTQTAASYDYGAGWSTLAERYGFALLVPEQRTANNPKRCFNWFRPHDTQRGRGEAASIRQMVETMILDHGIDRRRVFVTGLSAGGAMTSVMLAAYPDVFAAGAIIAGLPYGAAKNVAEAYESMFQGTSRPAAEWGDLVRRASRHKGPWPRVSVWHGDADATVKPMNADEIIKQWSNVHGLDSAPTSSEMVDGYPRQAWRNRAGEIAIESYTITSMAHGTPLATGNGDVHAGAAGAFLLDVGISSSYHIAKFFGLTRGKPVRVPERRVPIVPDEARADAMEEDAFDAASEQSRTPSLPQQIETVITKALKAAGLMK